MPNETLRRTAPDHRALSWLRQLMEKTVNNGEKKTKTVNNGRVRFVSPMTAHVTTCSGQQSFHNAVASQRCSRLSPLSMPAPTQTTNPKRSSERLDSPSLRDQMSMEFPRAVRAEKVTACDSRFARCTYWQARRVSFRHMLILAALYWRIIHRPSNCCVRATYL